MLPDRSIDELLALPGRATRALVDLDVLRENARRLKAHVGDSVELMAVVKADGYGHGAVMVAREALQGGATWLGVATVSEGIELRETGVVTDILVLGPIHSSEVATALTGRLDLTVGDEDLAEALIARATHSGAIPRIHLKVDTGMHRYGLSPTAALAVVERLHSCSPGSVFALCTHFASAEEPAGAATVQQRRIFRELAGRARQICPELKLHAANSAASLAGLAHGTTIARVGIALYGCGAARDQGAAVGLAPAMSVVSRVMRVRELTPGDGVSYGRTYVAGTAERVGLIPIGYADGYPRSLSNRGWMAIDGEVCPVRGRICMDQTVVGNLSKNVASGDWVGVAGPALAGPPWDDLAEICGTISYELLTSAGKRVTRVYHRSGTLVAVRDERGRLQEVSGNEKAPTA